MRDSVDVRTLPKAELHLHLEGAIRPATVIELARENGLEFPYQRANQLERALQFDDFLGFLAMFQLVNRCLAKPADFERIARELIQDLAAQNVIYAELRYAPMHPMVRGMRFDDVTAAVIAGMRQGMAVTGVKTALICGLTRQWDFCLETARDAIRWAGRGVDAIDIGGDEAGFPASNFVDLYREAAASGLQLTAHAGEAAGPDSVYAAVKQLGARRIGHGIRAIEDAVLLELLREEGVTLEVCPTSNVKTGIVSGYAEHPLRRLYDAGVRVTLNSDDPAMFQANVEHEYAVAASEFGFNQGELQHLTRNAIEAAFCPPDVRSVILRSLSDEE